MRPTPIHSLGEPLSEAATDVLDSLATAIMDDPDPESGRTYFPCDGDDYEAARLLVSRGLAFIISGNGTYYLCSAPETTTTSTACTFTGADEAVESGYDSDDILEVLAMLETSVDSTSCLGHWMGDYNPRDTWLFVADSNVSASLGIERFPSTPPGRWWVRAPGCGSHACVDFEPSPGEARAVLLLPERNTPDNDAPYTRADLESC